MVVKSYDALGGSPCGRGRGRSWRLQFEGGLLRRSRRPVGARQQAPRAPPTTIVNILKWALAFRSARSHESRRADRLENFSPMPQNRLEPFWAGMRRLIVNRADMADDLQPRSALTPPRSPAPITRPARISPSGRVSFLGRYGKSCRRLLRGVPAGQELALYFRVDPVHNRCAYASGLAVIVTWAHTLDDHASGAAVVHVGTEPRACARSGRAKWRDLAERRRAHFVELYHSGRWKHYYSEERFLQRMREAIRAWRCAGPRPPPRARRASRPIATRAPQGQRATATHDSDARHKTSLMTVVPRFRSRHSGGAVWIACRRHASPMLPLRSLLTSLPPSPCDMTSALFSPIRLADLELANRIVVSPMCQYSADDGVASDWHLNHLGMLANSGAAWWSSRRPASSAAAASATAASGSIRTTARRRWRASSPIAVATAPPRSASSSPMPAARPPRSGHGRGTRRSGRVRIRGRPIAPSAIPFGADWPAPRDDGADIERVREAFVTAAKRASASASTPSSCMERTAISCTASSHRSPTSAATAMAARSRRACAFRSRSRKRCAR